MSVSLVIFTSGALHSIKIKGDALLAITTISKRLRIPKA